MDKKITLRDETFMATEAQYKAVQERRDQLNKRLEEVEYDRADLLAALDILNHTLKSLSGVLDAVNNQPRAERATGGYDMAGGPPYDTSSLASMLNRAVGRG